jgi:hypothetical protein
MGSYNRYETSNGPVHVFIPDGYSGGGTVVYVHGYRDTVDSAWQNHRLQEQFQASGRDAMFIAIEAPSSSSEAVRWTNLGKLLDEVQFRTGIRPPDPVVAIAHSAGFETVAKWLSDPRLVTIFLLDALYGFVQNYLSWALQPGHQITLVVTEGGGTKSNTESFASKLMGIVKNPSDFLSAAAKTAKAVYVLSQKSHMMLVQPQSGSINTWTIPSLLASRSRISAIGSLQWGRILALGGLGVGLFFLFRR